MSGEPGCEPDHDLDAYEQDWFGDNTVYLDVRSSLRCTASRNSASSVAGGKDKKPDCAWSMLPTSEDQLAGNMVDVQQAENNISMTSTVRVLLVYIYACALASTTTFDEFVAETEGTQTSTIARGALGRVGGGTKANSAELGLGASESNGCRLAAAGYEPAEDAPT